MASEIASSLDPSAFAALASRFASSLRPGDAVGLHGELGAGKTAFVRAIVAALHGSADAVSSPTFVFRQRYAGTPPVEHLDLYRLRDPREAADLGLEEAFDAAAVTLVEWPERLPQLLPASAIQVRIAGDGEGPRCVRIDR